MSFVVARKIDRNREGIVNDDELGDAEGNFVELRAFWFDWH